MPNDGGEQEKLKENVKNDEIGGFLELEEGEIIDDEEELISESIFTRCISGTRKRQFSPDYPRSTVLESKDDDSFFEDDSEFFHERKIAHPRSRLSRGRQPSLQSVPTVRGGPMMLYSNVKVEVVEDPDRPCSVQSDDSFDDDDPFQVHRSRTHQTSLTEDLSNSFSSAVSFARQGSPRPGPSTRSPSVSTVPSMTFPSEANPRKRLLSAESTQSKRWKPEEPPNVIPIPGIHQPVIRKAYGYYVPSEPPPYDMLLNFYKQTIAAKAGDRCYYYNHHPVSLAPPDPAVQYNEFLNSTYCSAKYRNAASKSPQ